MTLFKRNRPWVSLRYDADFSPENYSEDGVESGAKLENHIASSKDLYKIFKATLDLGLGDFLKWLDRHSQELDDTTFVVNTDDGNALDDLRRHNPQIIINRMSLNRIRHLNTFLNKANEALVDGGYLWCHSRTARLKREVIYATYPGFVGKVV